MMSAIFCLPLCALAVFTSVAAEVDPQKPWTVNGTVATESGEPIAEATIIAHAGVGSLHMTGRTISDKDGKFQMNFGPGVWSKKQEDVQAATISVHKDGWFETNLYRQGDLLAAHKLPDGEIGWGKKTAEDVFLPGKPKTLKFTLKPAASISGILADTDGKPLSGIRVGVTGEELRPSTSVFAEVKTDEKGQFKFSDLPTTFKLKIYFETKKNWRDWPSYTVLLREPKHFQLTATRARDNFELKSEPPMEILSETTREKKK
jgi:hypothetical protein